MFTLILAIFLAAVALTVLAYTRRHSLPLWVAAMFIWGLAIRFGETQLVGFAHSVQSSSFGA